MITAHDVLTTQGKHLERAEQATEEHAVSAGDLAMRLNRLFADPEMEWFEGEPEFNDGYRDQNVTYGAKRSSHKEGKAVDIGDKRKSRLSIFLVAHSYLLERYGLWMEDPRHTPTWCHLQSRPVRGRRIFIP